MMFAFGIGSLIYWALFAVIAIVLFGWVASVYNKRFPKG